MTLPPHTPHLNPEEVTAIIEHVDADRRGSFIARPVLLQPLSTFGSPAVAVLTHEDDVSITVASVLMHSPDHRVVIYDDEAPPGARSLFGVIDQIRTASRPSDQTRSISMIYIRKQEPLPE